MNIYLDMDDVVADWHSYAQEILKLRWDRNGERIPQEQWDKIKEDLRFYRNLPLMEGAHELVDMCQAYIADNPQFHLRFLTALPHDYSMPLAAYDKVFWAHEHFPYIPVTIGPFSHDKWRHCKNPGDILIDDRHSNCEEWEAQGGIAHIYTTWEACRPWLEEILGVSGQKL
jgi:5'(3')-deoxyribonucleotidase